MKLPAWVAQTIEELPERFTGNIQINCFEGGVGNVTCTTSRKPPQEAVTTAK